MTTAQMWLVGLMVIAYLLGSIPFGLIVGLSKGVDPRTAGSGNIGATNVGRLLGGKFFALVFLLDMLKSLLPMAAASAIVHGIAHPPYAPLTYLLWLLVGFAAILGHIFPIFLGFKGGKGVATSLGAALGLWPFFTLPGLIAGGAWLIIFLIWRYVSLASIIASAIYPLAYVLIGLLSGWPVFQHQLPLLVFSLLVCAMVVLRHRSNIARLRAGTEHAFR